MTKEERNKLILIGGASAVAIYLIMKGNKERQRREMIRQQQILQAQQQSGRGQGLANLIGGLGGLFKGKGKKRDKSSGNGITLPNVNLDQVFGGSSQAATIGNVGGGGLNMDDPFGVGSLNVPEIPNFNFNP
jgi:type II secretory pathway pseudopilin PulG